MTQADLFPAPASNVSDTSREAFARLLPTLTEREIEVFLGVCGYLRETGYEDVTGGELADWMRSFTTTVRPRITGLVKKGWLTLGASRKSRYRYESTAHPVFPAVPRSAVERAKLARNVRG